MIDAIPFPLFIALVLICFVMGLVWLVFPFRIIGRLDGITEHLKVIRDRLEADAAAQRASEPPPE
jgi:hypothetical protein